MGDTVADIFCGSGTTVLEALLLRRQAVGIDANPLSALITHAKITPLREPDLSEFDTFRLTISQTATNIYPGEADLFGQGKPFVSLGRRPDPETLEFWFEPWVVEELAEISLRISHLQSRSLRTLAEVAMSSIVVAVSKQDSDTRYVRRDKAIEPGDTLRRFLGALDATGAAAKQIADLLEDDPPATVMCANVLDAPDIPRVDLVVSSPPYPNAYSYHLYHRTRLLWLGWDPEKFKAIEIGSHRKYSRKGSGRATEETFLAEFRAIMAWLSDKVRIGGHCCFVVGDSTLDGRRVDNADIIAKAAEENGFREIARLSREIDSAKKSFNPVIGKIRSEKILVLRRR